MKRLLPYVILALIFHAVVLSTGFDWLNFNADLSPAARSLSITLTAAEPQKPPPAAPQEIIVKQPRPKKNLKALTYRKPPPKSREVAAPALMVKPQAPLELTAEIPRPVASDVKPVPHQLPEDEDFIKNTHQVPEEVTAPANISATPPVARPADTLSGSILKIARPLYSLNTPPTYPRKARRLGYEGMVILKVLIGKNGRVDDLMLLESSGYAVLDRAALSTVKKWRFDPGSEGGIKKKMWVKVPIRFKLE